MNKKDISYFRSLAAQTNSKGIRKGWVYVGFGGPRLESKFGHKLSRVGGNFNGGLPGLFEDLEYICPQKTWETMTQLKLNDIMPIKKAPAKKAALKTKRFTVLEYLEKLPSPYKEMAIYEANKQNVGRAFASSKHSAVSSFAWSITENGWGFWNEVAVACDGDDEYPEVPNKSHEKILKGILPDYDIILNKKTGQISAGCQNISREGVEKLFYALQDFFDSEKLNDI